jgi:hypothetical protein
MHVHVKKKKKGKAVLCPYDLLNLPQTCVNRWTAALCRRLAARRTLPL